MEKKRYQVFVSSTFADLREERAKVFNNIMMLDCIPAGMELFPAFDQQQLEYIKTIIDDSDYYVLVIAGRYGSLTAEDVSFTEKEYDYAVSQNIPVLAFLHGDLDKIEVGKTDKDPKREKLLRAFRDKVSNNRIVRHWTSTEQLLLHVQQSLVFAIKTHPQVGWIRGSAAASLEILTQLNDVRRQNDELIAELNGYKSKWGDHIADLAGLSESFESMTIHLNLTWAEILAIVGPSFTAPQPVRALESQIANFLMERNQDFNSDFSVQKKH